MTKNEAINAFANGENIRIIVNGAWHSVMQDNARSSRKIYELVFGSISAPAHRRMYFTDQADCLYNDYAEIDGYVNMTYEIMPDSTPEW